MMKPQELTAAMLKMISVIKEFAPQDKARALMQQAAGYSAGFDFVAALQDHPLGRVSLAGEEITFETYDGLSGRLYPGFALDAQSLLTTGKAEQAELAVVLAALQKAFGLADDVRVLNSSLIGEEDDETFIVDPQIADTLDFEHQT